MDVQIHNGFDYSWELRPQPDLTSMPLSSENCTADLAQIVDELFTTGILAERLPTASDSLSACVRPVWKEEPIVERLEVELTAASHGERCSIAREVAAGPWVRKSQKKLLQLREEGSLGEAQSAYRMLVALPSTNGAIVPLNLQPPVIEDTTLADCGVRELLEGSLDPDRPVLVNRQFADDAVRMCEEADTLEAGGAALGRIVRLDEPLPDTTTRIVTILSSIVADPRHVGEASRFHFSPNALAAAQQMCDLRGLGEQILTVYHSHGWSNKCAKNGHSCNQNSACPLFECVPSVHDYEQLLGQLFPSKATLLPIAGRKLGAEGDRPVLQIHAWRGGEMKPIRWQTYGD